MASTYLTKTFSSSPTNAKIGTVSLWFKLANEADSSNTFFRIFATGASATNRTDINITASTGTLNFTAVNSSTGLATSQGLRDESGFYNLVASYDTTQSTASDRLKLYLSGEQITAFGSATYPAQNADLDFGNNSNAHYIGKSPHFSPRFFHGIISHFHYVDGTAYPASTFGSTDPTTGEWKINTAPTISSYGNNGFWILKDGNTITDSSPNSNNFTLGGGTLTKTEDCPSNVFATLNALAKPGAGNLPSFGNGNTHYNKTATGAGNNSMIVATLGATTGKFYYEYKMNDSNAFIAGISTLDNTYYDANGGSMNTASGVGVAYQSSGNKIINGTSTTYGNSYGSGNIVGVAFDLVNNFIYFSKDGVWQNSGDPTSGSSGTGGIGIATTGITYSPFAQNNGYNSPSSVYYNFGNGYFGTTAVASAGTNASGNGIFEYDVPTGYTALSTKGLNL